MHDLKSTVPETVNILQTFCRGLAQGNEGSAVVEQLEYCPPELNMSIKIRHRQVTRILGKTIVVYDMTTYVKTTHFEPHDPSAKDIKLCVDLPPELGGGQICASLEQILDALIALLPAGLTAKEIPCSSLHNTQYEEALRVLLDGFCLGNQGHAIIDDIAWCPPNTLRLRAELVNKHIALGHIIYDYTIIIEGEFVIVPPDADANICVDTPGGGQICIPTRDILHILGTNPA